RKLDVSVLVSRQKKQADAAEKRRKALVDIQKVLASRREVFVSGKNGLQSYRARAIQACLSMMTKNGRGMMEASWIAAEANGFSRNWGSRLVRRWTQRWIKDRTLPESLRGNNAKVFSILCDPTVRAKMRAYLRSNKWAVDPAKAAKFAKQQMVPEAAREFAQSAVQEEMPRGLKKYLEDEILPEFQLKPGGKGFSLSTMRRLMLDEGWVLDGEQPLRKKGQGRGIHRSDVICSTVGWLKDAGQSLEYGKNYEGYWTGELFVNQLKTKIIPAFEDAHGPGYQALFLIDNSQGHAAYAEDSLRATRMNLKPGGKQARMRDGWYHAHGADDQRIIQPMNFPPQHKEHPNEPKGMRQKWLRDHCDYTFETLKENVPKALESVSVATIRRWEHRTWRFVDAYGEGLDAKDCQKKVKEFSSRQYKSHRRIPETLARQMEKALVARDTVLPK
ncbi:hypothetical protein DENSPDRAFT_784921, partial [Dentipellis sp. KUC8613]